MLGGKGWGEKTVQHRVSVAKKLSVTSLPPTIKKLKYGESREKDFSPPV